MGQVNMIVMAILLFALWKRSGWVLSLASMIKMSPAILLVPYGIWKRKRLVMTAVCGAVLTSLIALFLVDLDKQLYFFLEVLPQFSSGEYLDLKVRINLFGNHSIADIFNHIFPHEDPERRNQILSPLAKNLSTATFLLILAFLSWLAFRTRDNFGRICVLGAFICLMVVTPVYTYEHHLVFMVIPVAIVIQSFRNRRLKRKWIPVAFSSYAFLAWKLGHLKKTYFELQEAGHTVICEFLKEGKFVSCLLLILLCVLAAAKANPNSVSN